jgi:hypothetical protein
LGGVALGTLDHFLGDGSAELKPDPDVGWEVDAGPDARLASLVDQRLQ